MVDVDDMTDSPLTTLAPLEPEWQPILHGEHQVVLYNATSHALSIRHHPSTSQAASVMRRTSAGRCPYCNRSLPTGDTLDQHQESELEDVVTEDIYQGPRSRAPNYFQLLQIANETGSMPSTPATSRRSGTPTFEPQEDGDGEHNETPFRAENMAEGYFKAFFQEECRLGMGANGSVYLCQHVLDGNTLGRFAVKKVAVGQSHSYLLNILREVRLLEKVHHPNIITYHHAWLETCQFSSFGPKVPTLHILMQWAEGGSLDDFIDIRMGRISANQLPQLRSSGSTSAAGPPAHDAGLAPDLDPANAHSRSARIRAFRALQHAPPEERDRLRREMAGLSMYPPRPNDKELKPIHLFSAEEVKSLFTDVVEGLAFLHDKSILHLDLKPGNVLLTWDDGKLIPRAMLSDFGTSQDMLNARARSGNTGTLEYASPESLPSPLTGLLSQVDSKSDMWSLGMILHKILFFRLPYRHASDSAKMDDSRRDGKEMADLLEREVLNYAGFKSSQQLTSAFETRHLPRAFLVLLENLLHVRPSARPSCERVLIAIREGRLDPVKPILRSSNVAKTSLVPVRRPSDEPIPGSSSAPSVPRSIDAVELPQWLDNAPIEELATEQDKPDSRPVLGLPSPPPRRRVPFLKLRLWNKEFVMVDETIAIRTIKSMLLVGKVWSIFSLSRDAGVNHELLAFALIPAIADSWFDGLTASIFLSIIHLGLIRLASSFTS